MSASSVSNLDGAGQPSSGPTGPEPNVENKVRAEPTREDPAGPSEPAQDYSQPCPNPKCGKEIDYLYNISLETHVYHTWFGGSGPTYDEEFVDTESDQFRCPECEFLIATNERDATDFMRDGTISEGANRRIASMAQEVTA